MQTKPSPISTIKAAAAPLLYAGLLVVTLTTGACTKSKVSAPRTQSPDRVNLNDFVDLDADQNNATQSVQADSGSDSTVAKSPPNTTPNTSKLAPSVDGLTLTSSNKPADSVDAQVPVYATQSAAIGSLSLLDAKVGDVNGKPIFTNSFFEPIEDRLVQESTRLNLVNWRRSAAQTISNRLDGIIADELLRAEALASLTPTQRVGLQAFLNNFRTNLLSENLGSSQLAKRRIQQEEGVTLDEALRQKEVDTLVQLTLIQEVNRRVNVSWRDIKQRYERDIDKFSPPPTAVFLVIRTFKDDADTINQIQSSLDNGTDFAEIASSKLNNYNTDGQGQHSALITESYEKTAFFGPESLNNAARTLTVGDSVGPIELGSSIYWIKLIDISQENVTLYDAQLQIQRDLTFERRKAAQTQYLGRLQERAKISSRDEVLIRLIQIAEQRYGPKS